ncbi:MAG: hypothetical protein AAGF87_16085 [Bacteroidota bacterium]
MRIHFKRTGNVFVNAGIVGIVVTLDNAKLWSASLKAEERIELPDYKYGFDRDGFWLESEEYLNLLNGLYRLMGKRYYDTSTNDALRDKDNRWYNEKSDSFHSFPKKSTYGFGYLLTNNRPTTVFPPGKKIRKSSLIKQGERGKKIVSRYEQYFKDNNLDLKSELYLGAPYERLPELIIDDKMILPGKQICPVTGEGYIKLLSASAANPVSSGLNNFLPMLSSKSDKIGWKPMYAIRFAPVLALYRYAGGLDSLYCYFYESSSLENLYEIYRNIKSDLYLDEAVKQAGNHLSNLKLISLKLSDKSEKEVSGSDFVHPYEVLFQLVFSMTQSLYFEETDQTGRVVETDFDEPLNLYLLRADKFAGTIRPNTFSVFNHFDYTRRYIAAAITYGIEWGPLLTSLKIHDPDERDYAKERLIRESLLKNLMRDQSFLTEMAILQRRALSFRLSGESAGFKNWRQLEKLIQFNEFGPLNNRTDMEKSFNENAYKLGTQIGMAIINSTGDTENGQTPMDRAKFGRKYIIDLDKSRTYDDFLEAIKRIQLRYKTSVNKELLLTQIDESNFRTAKLLAVIGSLNVINGKLSSKSNSDSSNN